MKSKKKWHNVSTEQRIHSLRYNVGRGHVRYYFPARFLLNDKNRQRLTKNKKFEKLKKEQFVVQYLGEIADN